MTTQDIAMKFCMTILHINCERSVSQIFNLGPSFCFMLFGKFCFENILKITRFFYIKSKPRHEYKI